MSAISEDGLTKAGNSPYAVSVLYGALKNVLEELHKVSPSALAEQSPDVVNLVVFGMAASIFSDLMSAGLRIVDKENVQGRLEI